MREPVRCNDFEDSMYADPVWRYFKNFDSPRFQVPFEMAVSGEVVHSHYHPYEENGEPQGFGAVPFKMAVSGENLHSYYHQRGENDLLQGYFEDASLQLRRQFR